MYIIIKHKNCIIKSIDILLGTFMYLTNIIFRPHASDISIISN